jgi:hypothetical protein
MNAFPALASALFSLQARSHSAHVARAWDLLCSAEENANDTVYIERAHTEDEWNAVALSTLELLVADEPDPKVRAVFTTLGFKV